MRISFVAARSRVLIATLLPTTTILAVLSGEVPSYVCLVASLPGPCGIWLFTPCPLVLARCVFSVYDATSSPMVRVFSKSVPERVNAHRQFVVFFFAGCFALGCQRVGGRRR